MTRHRNIQERVRCESCGRDFGRVSGLAMHQRRGHCLAPSVPIKSSVLACGECSWLVRVNDDPQPARAVYRHARRIHGRVPRVSELTPVSREESAA